MKKSFQPVIKWSGSKRSQCFDIIKYFPKIIDTFYEPFCGGCSVTRALIESDISVNRIVCSDLNNDLIELWNLIKSNPNIIFESYKEMWEILNKDNNIDRKRKYFESIREEYNNTHNPLLFMFIMRTTTNGMPRYNNKGEFNNSFHITRNGINPDRLKKILSEWSTLLNNHNVEFVSCSYENIIPNENDFAYFDPPYQNTKGMYFNNFETDKFLQYLGSLKCHYALSYDGISGENNYEIKMPTGLYNEHLYLKSGNSSFRRTIGKSNNTIVYESLFLK